MESTISINLIFLLDTRFSKQRFTILISSFDSQGFKRNSSARSLSASTGVENVLYPVKIITCVSGFNSFTFFRTCIPSNSFITWSVITRSNIFFFSNSTASSPLWALGKARRRRLPMPILPRGEETAPVHLQKLYYRNDSKLNVYHLLVP